MKDTEIEEKPEVVLETARAATQKLVKLPLRLPQEQFQNDLVAMMQLATDTATTLRRVAHEAEPEWAVQAHYETGVLFEEFAHKILSVPDPEGMAKHGEDAERHAEELDQIAARFFKLAQPEYQACLTRAADIETPYGPMCRKRL
ncbi:MAG: hypothetical protein AAFX99_24210, partial [Myxococcota bacterium]